MVNRVYIEGGDHLTHKMFNDQKGWWVSPNLEDADFVVFTGGADVPPELYGEKNVASSCRPEREIKESLVYEACVRTGKKMIGICRGGQFLNVMNGGKMWQHVDNHAIGGTHPVRDIEGTIHECTSTHHQMMRPSKEGLIVATGGKRSTVYVNDQGEHKPAGEDVEVVWYKGTRSLCFQPHPEYGYDSCRDYFFKLVDRYYGVLNT